MACLVRKGNTAASVGKPEKHVSSQLSRTRNGETLKSSGSFSKPGKHIRFHLLYHRSAARVTPECPLLLRGGCCHSMWMRMSATGVTCPAKSSEPAGVRYAVCSVEAQADKCKALERCSGLAVLRVRCRAPCSDQASSAGHQLPQVCAA